MNMLFNKIATSLFTKIEKTASVVKSVGVKLIDKIKTVFKKAAEEAEKLSDEEPTKDSAKPEFMVMVVAAVIHAIVTVIKSSNGINFKMKLAVNLFASVLFKTLWGYYQEA